MKIMHRTSKSAFSHPPAAGTRSYGASERITSFPLEGHYFEGAEPERTTHESSAPYSIEIERFLTSLMYGE